MMQQNTSNNPSLFLVTVKNLDKTTKTILRSYPIKNAVSNYELTPEQISALWFAGQADLPKDRGPIPPIVRRRISLFSAHNPTYLNSIKLKDLDLLQRESARRVALALNHAPEKESSGEYHQFFHSYINISNELLDAALDNDIELVKRFLEVDPNYLFSRATITGFSGQIYRNITLLQAALITGNYKLSEIIKPYFDRFHNGQEEMQNQLLKLFPEGVEVHDTLQSENTFKFGDILNAIRDASPEEIEAALSETHLPLFETAEAREKSWENLTLKEKITRFRAAFTEHSHNEMVFNPKHSMMALILYVKHLDWKDRSSSNKLKLFWSQVLGFTQLFWPAFYLNQLTVNRFGTVENLHNYQQTPYELHESIGFHSALAGNLPLAKASRSQALVFQKFFADTSQNTLFEFKDQFDSHRERRRQRCSEMR